MKLKYLIILFIFLPGILKAQEYMIKTTDEKTGEPMLHGQITFQDILKEPEYTWFKEGAETYFPKEETLKKLKYLAPQYRYIIFMGTWCDDTKYLLPQVFNTLQLSKVDISGVEMYAVDRGKKALHIETDIYHIEKVPTIIIMNGFREVGRIVENVQNSFEEDLLAILERDNSRKEEQ